MCKEVNRSEKRILIKKILISKIPLKPQVFLLGLMDKQLKKSWNFIFIYDDCSEIIICSKMKRFDTIQNGEMVAEYDRTCGDG